MRRYTLNERGRIIWIETPLVIVMVTLSSTNAIEIIARWMMGY